jgi:hypothetical protein
MNQTTMICIGVDALCAHMPETSTADAKIKFLTKCVRAFYEQDKVLVVPESPISDTQLINRAISFDNARQQQEEEDTEWILRTSKFN